VIRESGLVSNFHACLPNIAILKALRLLKPMPPKPFGTVRRSQDILNIAFIPKGNAQTTMKDWRPIKLCNILYNSNNGIQRKFLVHWEDSLDLVVTWKNATCVRIQYPNFNLEDKVDFHGGLML